MNKLLYSSLLVIILTACSNTSKESVAMTDLSMKTESAMVPSLQSSGTGNVQEVIDTSSRKLIKDGSLEFQTNNVNDAGKYLKSNLHKFGAYITSESSFNNKSRIGYNMTIRVPSVNFDNLMNEILKGSEIKKVTNKSVQITDVTEEFIDVEARMKIKKETEKKMLELMDKAKNLTETLEVQRQLTELRAEIESVEGRLKYLNNQVNYSTLNVSFYETNKDDGSFSGNIWEAFKNGWRVFLQLITILTNIWIIILFIVLVVVGIKLYKKRKRKKKVD